MDVSTENDVVTLDCDAQRTRAIEAYRFMAPFVGLTIGFGQLFNGLPKAPTSVESALHDALIYFFVLEEDLDTVVTVFNVSHERVLNILNGHQDRKATSTYYRIYVRRLDENAFTFFPKQYIEPRMVTDLSIEAVAEQIYTLLTKRTGVGREIIASNSQTKNAVRCKTVLVNLIDACFANLKPKTIAPFINGDHSGVYFHRKCHKNYRNPSIQGDPIVRDYWRLYDYTLKQLKEMMEG
ncbi:MAG: hypothetical protein JWL92_605 [Candidatus Nomurabacteria bacterium]|nr:hypothetical protein [Candidatus Nomurabacteria bacterium]